MKGHGREEEELHKRRRDDWGWKLFGFPMGTRGLAMHHPYNRVSLRGGKQLPLPGGLRGRHRSWRGPPSRAHRRCSMSRGGARGRGAGAAHPPARCSQDASAVTAPG